jgi:hypothetical protein
MFLPVDRESTGKCTLRNASLFAGIETAIEGKPMAITERALRQMFVAAGFRIRGVRCNSHWWVQVQREDGGPVFGVPVSTSPSCPYFEFKVMNALRRAERAALERIAA